MENASSHVSIQLTPGQVAHVLREASDANNLAIVLSGLQGVREALARQPALLKDPRDSRALVTGLFLLATLPPDGTYIRAAELAKSLDMSASSAHRYLNTLVHLGLVEQDPATRRYRLAT
jgi:Fic family protein